MIIWGWGAWNYYLMTGDRDFLSIACPAIENTFADCLKNEFDPADGLFRGGACFQDGIAGYPDRLISRSQGSCILACLYDNPSPDFLVAQGHGLPCKALSTNALYLLAAQSALKMRQVLGLDENAKMTSFAEKLKQSIRKAFWNADAGTFRYLLDAGDTQERQEGLGIAFAALSGIADEPMFRSQIEKLHLTPHGLPCVWPEYERYDKFPDHYARHSGSIWPQVNAAFVSALVDFGFRQEAVQEMALLAQKAVRDNMFYELYHPETGLQDGGMQECNEKGIIHWNSCARQSWAASGFIHMVLKALFGFHFAEDSVSIDPVLPEGCPMLKLSGLYYRNREINLTVRPAREDEVPTPRPYLLTPGDNLILLSECPQG